MRSVGLLIFLTVISTGCEVKAVFRSEPTKVEKSDVRNGPVYEELNRLCHQKHLSYRVVRHQLGCNADAWDADFDWMAGTSRGRYFYGYFNEDCEKAAKALLAGLSGAPNQGYQPFDTGEVKP